MSEVLKIEKACLDAKEKFEKLDPVEFKEIVSKIDYVIGSFNYDNNPVGLYEIGEEALALLVEYKKSKPRAVAKKLIEDIQKALKEQAVA